MGKENFDAEKNFHDMLYGYHCKVKIHDGIIEKYDLNSPYIEIIYSDGTNKIRLSSFNAEGYGGYLENCIGELEEEIEYNLRNSQTDKVFYLNSIIQLIKGRIDFNIKRIPGLENSDKTELTPKPKETLEIYKIQNEYLTLFLSGLLEKYSEFSTNDSPRKNRIGKNTTTNTQNATREIINDPESFDDIFKSKGWKKYILALEKTVPALLNAERKFIGKPKKHKGVICSWIKHLQNEDIIKQSLSRSQLSNILNKEFKDFNMGKDGKTFDNYSKAFDEDFKEQLLKLVG